MPSGKTHTRIDLGMLGVTLFLAAFFWNALCRLFGRDEMAEYGAIFVVAYLFGTFLLTPDMDLATSDPMALARRYWSRSLTPSSISGTRRGMTCTS